MVWAHNFNGYDEHIRSIGTLPLALLYCRLTGGRPLDSFQPCDGPSHCVMPSICSTFPALEHCETVTHILQFRPGHTTQFCPNPLAIPSNTVRHHYIPQVWLGAVTSTLDRNLGPETGILSTIFLHSSCGDLLKKPGHSIYIHVLNTRMLCNSVQPIPTPQFQVRLSQDAPVNYQ